LSPALLSDWRCCEAGAVVELEMLWGRRCCGKSAAVEKALF
jgi:hypothetical protein